MLITIKKKRASAGTGEDVAKLEPSYTAGRNVKWFGYSGRQFGSSQES